MLVHHVFGAAVQLRILSLINLASIDDIFLLSSFDDM